jgi:catechol 2,3-dioxygenase-like lactoylglutathione lyase family enzyme
MLFNALHHVGIIVKDLEASLEFYHRVLGLEFSNEPSPVFSGEGLETGVGIKGASLRQVSLLLGDTTIELLEYLTPKWPISTPVPQYVTGASHIAFKVDDIYASKKALEAKGLKFFSDVNVVNEGVLAGWRWIYFADPDGHILELVQVAYYNSAERAAAIADYKKSRGWGMTS